MYTSVTFLLVAGRAHSLYGCGLEDSCRHPLVWVHIGLFAISLANHCNGYIDYDIVCQRRGIPYWIMQVDMLWVKLHVVVTAIYLYRFSEYWLFLGVAIALYHGLMQWVRAQKKLVVRLVYQWDSLQLTAFLHAIMHVWVGYGLLIVLSKYASDIWPQKCR